MGVEWRERGEKRKKKEYVAARACGARLGSARFDPTRLGSARSTGNFQSAFRVSAFGGRGKGEGGERVCVTLLADTGGFERKAHKYA